VRATNHPKRCFGAPRIDTENPASRREMCIQREVSGGGVDVGNPGWDMDGKVGKCVRDEMLLYGLWFMVGIQNGMDDRDRASKQAGEARRVSE